MEYIFAIAIINPNIPINVRAHYKTTRPVLGGAHIIFLLI